MTKKNILLTGIVALVLLILLMVGEAKLGLECSFRINERIDPNFATGFYWDTVEWCEPLAFVLISFLPLLFFSLTTYRMKDEVFRAWWNFARWMVPIIILATIVANLMPNNHGFFNMDDLIYLLVLAPLYAILILVSLWKIFATYRKLK